MIERGRERERERESLLKGTSVGSEGAEAEVIACAQRFPLHASVERREEAWRPFRDELWSTSGRIRRQGSRVCGRVSGTLVRDSQSHIPSLFTLYNLDTFNFATLRNSGGAILCRPWQMLGTQPNDVSTWTKRWHARNFSNAFFKSSTPVV